MFRRPTRLLLCLLMLAVAGCASRDTKAANAAAEAQTALQLGRNAEAARAIHEALNIRDDVSEYWLLLGRIDTATNDLSGAFSAYENALGLDHGNAEALRLLCQLSLTTKNPNKVDQYANQLLLMNPDDTLPIAMKGEAALERNDVQGARKFAEQVLAKSPQDSDALILNGRIMAYNGDFAAAAKFIEGSFVSQSGDVSRLTFLKELYTQGHDRARYQWTLQRLALAKPSDSQTQLEYADMLYQTGQAASASKIIAKISQTHADDIGIAAKILDVWLMQGPDALSLQQIAGQATNNSLETQSAYAQFANEIGHPEIARALLETKLINTPVTVANADAKAALAYAIGLQGHRADAIGRLSEILAFDSSHPRALLDRARLRSADKDFAGAIEDARHAVAQDPNNAIPRLSLAEILFANGNKALGESALREGVSALPGDCRLVARLAQFLIQQGQRKRANELLRDLSRAAPVSLRAERLRISLDPSAKTEAHS